MRTKLGILAATIGLVCVAVPAIAHHGFDTEYDAKKKFKLQGVVSAGAVDQSRTCASTST